jgi:hypothetical protein
VSQDGVVVVGVEFGVDLARLEDTDPDVGLGELLTERFADPLTPNFVML